MSHKRGHISNPPTMPHPWPGYYADEPSEEKYKEFTTLKGVLGGGIKAMAERNIRRRKRLVAEGKIETMHRMKKGKMKKAPRRRRETRAQFMARRKEELSNKITRGR